MLKIFFVNNNSIYSNYVQLLFTVIMFLEDNKFGIVSFLSRTLSIY